MNLKLNLICTLLFCSSFFNMIGQTKTETVQQGQDRLKNFVTKNDPADEPYRKEMYKKYKEDHTRDDGLYWPKLPNSTTHSIEELKTYFALKSKCDPESLALRHHTNIGGYLKYGIGLDIVVETYCMKITKITYNELGQMLRDIDDSFRVQPTYPEYGVYSFFESCLCIPQAAGGVGVPPLFLVGEAPCSRGEFLNRVYKYYVVKRRDPEKWLEVINQKNTNGETILDFFKNLETHGNYNTDEIRACIKEDIKFICEHGGVHAFGKGTKDDYCECLKNK